MTRINYPVNKGFVMPPEWYPHARCWMAWPCHEETWANIGLEPARLAYRDVALAITQYEPVSMLVRLEDKSSAFSLLGDKVDLISMPLNDSWTRDTGPTFLLNDEKKLAGVDWIHNAWGGNYPDCSLDNQIAAAIIDLSRAEYFNAPLVMEGGSFHVDGLGTILTSRECLLNPNRNPGLCQQEIEFSLCNYLGGKKVIWLNRGLEGDETDGHVDEIACFIAPGKVLALITHDKTDINFDRLHENLEILQTATDAQGNPLQVYTVEQPPATYAHGERLTLSYINFYLANKGLVIPAFGYEEYDHKAYQLFASLFPSYRITQLNALNVFQGGGGIHCITQQQPVSL